MPVAGFGFERPSDFTPRLQLLALCAVTLSDLILVAFERFLQQPLNECAEYTASVDHLFGLFNA